jgi:hypothetical protein
MDISPLVQSLTSFLTPLLPYLGRMGEEDAELAGAHLAGESWEDAKELWRRLLPRLLESPAGAGAGEADAALSAEPEVRDILGERIEDLLRRDPELAGELERILDPRKVTSGYEVTTGDNVSEGSVVVNSPDSPEMLTIPLSYHRKRK